MAAKFSTEETGPDLCVETPLLISGLFYHNHSSPTGLRNPESFLSACLSAPGPWRRSWTLETLLETLLDLLSHTLNASHTL